MTCHATVVIPTSIDRGPLLRYSVASVLRQTLPDIEVFIIGDGAHPVTAEIAVELEKRDSRVRFFEYPKGTRRGETHRHEVLTTHASGQIVCYLCDRDLMLPHHVARMHLALSEHDFANSAYLDIRQDGRVLPQFPFDSGDPVQRARLACRGHMGMMLSTMAHRLDFYRTLPYGWRTTPEGWFTDHYMQHQMLSERTCRSIGVATASIAYFKRGHHPGLPTQDREKELAQWEGILNDSSALAEILLSGLEVVLADRLAQRERLRYRLLVAGHPPGTAATLLLRRLLRRKDSP